MKEATEREQEREAKTLVISEASFTALQTASLKYTIASLNQMASFIKLHLTNNCIPKGLSLGLLSRRNISKIV